MKIHEDIYVACIPTLVVLTYNFMIYYPKLRFNYFHHCWETRYHLTSSQLTSGLSAGSMFKWCGYLMRIRNQNNTSEWNTLVFLDIGVLTCSGGSKGGPGGPWPSQIFGGPPAWPPSFVLNFTFKFYWLTYTAVSFSQQNLKRFEDFLGKVLTIFTSLYWISQG